MSLSFLLLVLLIVLLATAPAANVLRPLIILIVPLECPFFPGDEYLSANRTLLLKSGEVDHPGPPAFFAWSFAQMIPFLHSSQIHGP